MLKFVSSVLLCLQRKRFKRHLLAESEYHSARLLFLFHADIFYVYSSFTKLKSDHSVFASNFEIIQSILDLKPLMLHVCSIFVWIRIKMQWLPHFKWKKHRQSLILFICIDIF